MRRIALPAIAAVTSMVMTPLAVSAEPMVLTASQMESVTAAAGIDVNLPINVATGAVRVPTNVSTGGLLVQTNLTTQVASAIALAFATCGVCTDGAPAASSFASAGNFAASAQSQQ
jgi:hypothetical protein